MKLRYQVKEIRLKHRWTISRGSLDSKQIVFVYLEQDGLTGIGEASPNARYDETAESTVSVIEAAISRLANADARLYYETGLQIQQLAKDQTAAKAALDIALMDWAAKSCKMPLYRYLGLNKEKAPVTSYTIGIDAPEIIRQKIREAEDFPVYKIKLGGGNDEEMIAAVRSVTAKPLRIDANEGWKTREEALEKILWLQTQNVEFVEQPLPSQMLEETAWVRERAGIPIIADESVKNAADIPKLVNVFDGINIKLMKSGGLQEALRMIWLAKTFGMKIMLGCMVESSVGISAAASISPLVDYADLDGNLLLSNDPFSGAGVENGRLVLNDSPGIGIIS